MPVEIPAAIRTRIAQIQADNRSGAVALAAHAAEALAAFARDLVAAAEAGTADSRQGFRASLVEVCRALVAAQPAMASILNVANSALWEADRAASTTLAPGAVEAACRTWVETLRSSGRRISRHASRLLAGRGAVITHSYSQTVLEALLAARETGQGPRVICTESRPLCEGTAMAKSLAEAGIEVTLVADAAVYAMMAKAELAIAGADSVSARGLVNKTGTSLLALAAREWKRGFYALCGSEKFLPAGYEPPPEPPKPPAEIAPPVPNVSIENFYFDRTPLELVTGVVTEDGVLGREELRQCLAGRRLHPALARGR